MKTTTNDILSRLGKNAKSNQNHASGIDADKKDPNTPLPDTTAAGAIDGSTSRPLDKNGAKEPIDKSKGESPTDAAAELQDASSDYAGIYQGKGSVATKAVIGKKLKEGIDVKIDLTDMRGLLESSEADEEFIKESLAIFEATMLSVLNAQVDTMVESASDLVEAVIAEEVEALEEQVEEYLNVAVMEWAEDNKLVIAESTRVNIAESFMSEMVNLLEAYNINLPEESVDLYEHSLVEGEKLLNENDELRAKLADKTEELHTLNKAIYVESFIHDNNFTIAEADRLRSVADELEFINDSDFTTKLNTISESYIKTSNKVIKEGQIVKNPKVINEGSDDYLEEKEEKEAVYVDPTVSHLAKNFKA